MDANDVEGLFTKSRGRQKNMEEKYLELEKRVKILEEMLKGFL